MLRLLLTDEQWDLIKGMFPPPAGTGHAHGEIRGLCWRGSFG